MKGCGFTDHYFTDNRSLKENRKVHSFRFSGHLLHFTTDNGVFSKEGVDYGTQVMLKALLSEPPEGRVLDLGCGYGVIGICVKKQFPSCEVVCSDINPRAAELAELNCRENGTDCTVIISDGFSGITDRFDTVITNPPIRTGKKVIYRMFEDASEHLNCGGTFLAVIRRQQGAESAVKKLTEIFGNCEVIYREKGYWILKCLQLTA
jgi:16S rRNA (guanine1207-N2)-methyltransferase